MFHRISGHRHVARVRNLSRWLAGRHRLLANRGREATRGTSCGYAALVGEQPVLPRFIYRVCSPLLLAATLVCGVACQQGAFAQSPPSPERVKAIAEMLPESPVGLGRPIADRKAWDAAARLPGLSGIVAEAKKMVGQPIPELTEDLYLDFSRTGNRTRCQRVISNRHGRIPVLAIAECVENKGRFVSALEDAIRAVCSENTWVLPAHDRKLENWYGKTVEIDLVSAATSWNLGIVHYWLGEKLSPDVRDLIRKELERRTFTPFESYATQGKPRLWWATGTNNWNAVCLAGVTGSALAMIEAPKRRAFFVAAAEKYVKNFLKGFTADGYCSEGIGYYNYGFGHFLLLSETLAQATDGKIDLMKDNKVRQIALFGPRMEIVPAIYPAFADCSPHSRPDITLLAYLSRKYGLGWEDVERQAKQRAGSSRSLFDLSVFDFPNSLDAKPQSETAASGRALRDWFSDAQVLICRPRPDNVSGFGVAIKGGHNAEHHNHNDVGTFVVALDGQTPLLDPGSEVYTSRTFSSKRYESNVLNSFGHPVPLVAGQMQRSGRKAAARVLKTEFTDQQDTIVLDIRSAYAVKSLKRLERTFVFSRVGAGSLTVTDEVEFDSPQTFATALITFSPQHRIEGHTIRIGDGKGRIVAEVTVEAAEYEIQQEEIHEDVHSRQLPVRLGINLTKPVRQATIAVTIRPFE